MHYDPKHMGSWGGGGGALRSLVVVTSASSHALILSDVVWLFCVAYFPPFASAAD